MGRFINADALVSTGQGILGNNMFAYCNNKPIISSDPSGYCGCGAKSIDKNLSFSNMCPSCGGAGCGGVVIPIPVPTDVIVAVADMIETTAQKVIAWVDTRTGEKEYNNNSVYVLIDPTDNLIKYVGRTNDPVRRANEHRNDITHPWRQNYKMEVLITGLSKEQAIVWEQTLISAFTLTYLENARREIAVRNTSKYYCYLNAVTELIAGVPADDIKGLINGR